MQTDSGDVWSTLRRTVYWPDRETDPVAIWSNSIATPRPATTLPAPRSIKGVKISANATAAEPKSNARRSAPLLESVKPGASCSSFQIFEFSFCTLVFPTIRRSSATHQSLTYSQAIKDRLTLSVIWYARLLRPSKAGQSVLE
jgi:hypothetical protein